MKRAYLLLGLAFVGIADAGYLTIEHFSGKIPPCSKQLLPWADCGQVLRSQYAVLAGLPLSVWGLMHYSLMLVWLTLALGFNKSWARKMALLQSAVGFGFSGYLVFLQLGVIKAICYYCMLSALTSTALFFVAWKVWKEDRNELLRTSFGWLYKTIFKPIVFSIDPEVVHVSMVQFGQLLSRLPGYNWFVGGVFREMRSGLAQTVAGIRFELPVGLAAGFDYEARLTQTLKAWGFGFQSVGTITNRSYAGNPKPRLGRLPKSRSLLVNKGYKNPGAEVISRQLGKLKFSIPVGVSIGRTNSQTPMGQKESVADVVHAFKTFEKANIANAYYELNISCPNLYGDVEFYSTAHLQELLTAVDALRLKKPVFVKMPIEKTEAEFLRMCDVIIKHSPVGIIVGNLQKNRNTPGLDSEEVAKCGKGNFSGKPTWADSNALIRAAYKKYKKRLIIIGCGGVFSGEDAWTKIALGATLIQLITGMIYEGPQLVSEINAYLEKKLRQEGYTSLAEARGSAA